MRSFVSGLSLAILFTCTNSATAGETVDTTTDALKCGNHLVNIGDTEYQVIEHCGEPSYREGNRWTYNQGAGALLRILTFADGTLQSIVLGNRQ